MMSLVSSLTTSAAFDIDGRCPPACVVWCITCSFLVCRCFVPAPQGHSGDNFRLSTIFQSSLSPCFTDCIKDYRGLVHLDDHPTFPMMTVVGTLDCVEVCHHAAASPHSYRLLDLTQKWLLFYIFWNLIQAASCKDSDIPRTVINSTQ